MGHVDLKFSLQPGCVSLPPIEVTLYRALKNKPKSCVSPSSSSAGGSQSQSKIKAVSNEFLKSINAVPVCGPLELGSNLDLSGQGGNVVMTSPNLVLNKSRNFYLHIRAKSLTKGDPPESSNNQAQASNAGTVSSSNKEVKIENVKATPSTSNYKLALAKVFHNLYTTSASTLFFAVLIN